MALTASATPTLVHSFVLDPSGTNANYNSVQDDIVANLKMSGEHFFKVVHPFNRKNIYYEVKNVTITVCLR
jgi:hypothetical protein